MPSGVRTRGGDFIDLGLSTFPRDGSRHGGPVKRGQKKQLKMGGRRAVGVRPLLTLDTENEAGGEFISR